MIKFIYNKNMYKYFICLVLILCCLESKAQNSYKIERSTFSVVSRLGLPGGSPTKDEFKSYYSIGARREFSLGKVISLNAITDYNTMPGKNSYANLNLVCLGGGITFYPMSIIDPLILGIKYDNNEAKKDGFYFEEEFETNLNNSQYGNIGKVFVIKFEFNIVKIHLNKNLIISPKFGITANTSNNFPGGQDKPLNFTYLGVGIDFSRNKK